MSDIKVEGKPLRLESQYDPRWWTVRPWNPSNLLCCDLRLLLWLCYLWWILQLRLTKRKRLKCPVSKVMGNNVMESSLVLTGDLPYSLRGSLRLLTAGIFCLDSLWSHSRKSLQPKHSFTKFNIFFLTKRSCGASHGWENVTLDWLKCHLVATKAVSSDCCFLPFGWNDKEPRNVAVMTPSNLHFI